MTGIERAEREHEAYVEYQMLQKKSNDMRANANEILLDMMKLLSERSKEEPLPLQIETAEVLAELAKAICW